MARSFRRRKKRMKDTFHDEMFRFGGFVLVLFLAYKFLSQINQTGVNSGSVVFAVLKIGALALTVVIGAVVAYRIGKFILAKLERRYLYQTTRSLAEVLSLTPQKCEEYVGGIFEKQGYAVEVTQFVGDHGIDLKLKKDGLKHAVQVKRYGLHRTVGEPMVRDFYGSYIDDGYAGGFFITTSSFTPSARKWAENRRIKLIDGGEFAKLIRAYGTD